MSTKVRYTQPLLGSHVTEGYLIAVHDADEVLITQDDVPCNVYADNDGTALENPVTLGVAPGTAGVSTRGELLVYLDAGRGYGARVTVGQDVTTVAFPDVSADADDVVVKGAEVFNLRDHARGDGSDEGLAIAAALALAAGKKLIIPHTAAGYATSIPLAVSPGTTVEFQNHRTVVRQLTFAEPVFDCLNSDDVKIVGGDLRYTGDRTIPGVMNSFRGSAGKIYSAGIWSNGERCIFRDQRVSGFVSGIYLSNWNGTDLSGYKAKNKIEGLVVDTVDWGVLYVGQSDLYFDVRGSYVQSPGSTDPAHLVYGSGGTADSASDNRQVTAGPCEAWDGVGGHAYQLKNTTGGKANSMVARNCPGLLNALKLVDFTVQSPVATGDVSTTDAGSMIVGVGCQRTKVLDPKITMATEHTVATLAGVDCEISGLSAAVVRSVVSDAIDVVVSGTRNRLRNTKVVNSGAGASIAVSVTTGDSNTVSGVEALNCKVGVSVSAGATNTQVTIDPTAIVPAAGVGAASRHVDVSEPSTVVRRASQTTTRTVAAGVLNDDVIEATRYDTVVLQVNDAVAFTVPVPFEPAAGLSLTFQVFDNSAGMGAVTWPAGYDLRSAWTNPPPGGRRFITFTYDGTKWREQSRDVSRRFKPAGTQAAAGGPDVVHDALMATGVYFSTYYVNNVFGGEGDPGQFSGYNIPNVPSYDPTKFGMYIGWEPNYNDGDGTGHGGSVPNDLNQSVKSEHYWQFDIPRVSEVVQKAIAGNVATVWTRWVHPAVVGQTVNVVGVDATFNGTYVVTAKTARSIQYAKAHADIAPAVATGTVDIGSDPSPFWRPYYAWINHADGTIGMVLTADSFTLGDTSGNPIIGASRANLHISKPVTFGGAAPTVSIGDASTSADATLNLDGDSGSAAGLINWARNGVAAWKHFRVGGFSDYVGLWDYANAKFHVLYTRGVGAGGGSTDFGSAVTIAGNVGFYGHAAAAKPAVTGSRGGNAALASLLTGLAGLGLLTDSTTA